MTPTVLRFIRRAVATLFVAAFAVTLLAVSADAQTTDATVPDSEGAAADQKWTLRYKFQEDETLRWKVLHQTTIKMTVSGVSQTSEMASESVKVWKVVQVKDDGTVAFEYSIESVNMFNKVSGHKAVTYNSKTDPVPPVGFETMAATIGKLLSTIKLSSTGKVVERHQEDVEGMAQNENQGSMTPPLPEDPVAIDESWSIPYDITVPLNNGAVRTIKARQKYTLRKVSTGVASIEVATVLLTPVRDPAVEVQVVQRQPNGMIRFDIDAGRIMGQQTDVDEIVRGFTPNKPASRFHYTGRFTEQLLSNKAKVASVPQAPSAPAALPTPAIGPSPLPTAGALKPEVIPDAPEIQKAPETAERETVSETETK